MACPDHGAGRMDPRVTVMRRGELVRLRLESMICKDVFMGASYVDFVRASYSGSRLV